MVEKFFHKWLQIPYRLAYTDTTLHSDRTVVFLHGIGSSKTAWEYVIDQDKIDQNTRIITLDLLGFGQSPKPSWVHYDSKTHAKSVIRSLHKLGIKKDITLVGHSLGSIIAIEIVKQKPKLASHLVLCSPPLYDPERSSKKLPPREKAYIKFYAYLRKNPELFLKMTKKTASLINKFARDFDLSDETLPAYMNSLQASIENQSAMKDLMKLNLKIDILYGTKDFLLVKNNIKKAASSNPKITLHPVSALHQINRNYSKHLMNTIGPLKK